MMKLGCMSLSYKDQFASGAIGLEGFIERAYELGLDGIDIHTRAFASTDPGYLRAIRMQALKRGIALSYIEKIDRYSILSQETGSKRQEKEEYKNG